VPGGWGPFGEDEPSDRELLAASNGREQARHVQTMVRAILLYRARTQHPGLMWVITPDQVCELNRIAMAGLIPTAGKLSVTPRLVRAAGRKARRY
jgi:hypothetical protein